MGRIYIGSKNFCNKYKAIIPEGAEYDEYTGHIFVQDGDTVVEKKYCHNCGKWETLDKFYHNKYTKDGLTHWCKECSNAYNKKKQKTKRMREKSGKPVIIKEVVKEEVKKEETPTTDFGKVFNDYIHSLVAEKEAKIEELEKRVAELEEEKKKLVDVSKLSDAEFEKLVMERKGVAPRVYFNAIKKLDVEDKFRISVYDTSTGFTNIIKGEVA